MYNLWHLFFVKSRLLVAIGVYMLVISLSFFFLRLLPEISSEMGGTLLGYAVGFAFAGAGTVVLGWFVVR